MTVTKHYYSEKLLLQEALSSSIIITSAKIPTFCGVHAARCGSPGAQRVKKTIHRTFD